MVCIVILNWNGWGDTVECLESVFRLEGEEFQVVVCDNGSTDGSVERIRAWADGSLPPVRTPEPLRDLTDPPVPKPIPCREYGCDDIARLSDGTGESAPLVLIRTGENRGFAWGNNAGLRYAMKRRDLAYVWLLNNDTVVRRDALTAMVRQMRRNRSAGICGSKILSYREPDRVQSLGGCRFNRWLGISRHIGTGTAASSAVDQVRVLRRMAYVTGTSMLVSRPFLADVGLMDESHFLYYEEIDWTIRAKGRYSLAFAPDSIVYHKEGASTGTTRSRLADYHIIRSRLLLTRRHFPHALPTVYLGLVCMLLNRIRRSQWDRVALILRTAAGASPRGPSQENP
ncbi:MAG: glycosyltransferase family 2 protein [Thermodesulfobacteriota bacterium]